MYSPNTRRVSDKVIVEFCRCALLQEEDTSTGRTSVKIEEEDCRARVVDILPRSWRMRRHASSSMGGVLLQNFFDGFYFFCDRSRGDIYARHDYYR